MDITESPRKIQSNALNCLLPTQVGSSRGAVKTDLQDKIIYNDENVYRRLRVWEVNDAWVRRCATALKIDREKDVTDLKNLVSAASKRTNEELEREEADDSQGDNNKGEKSGNHGTRAEKLMYDPLVNLFRFIATFEQTTSPRVFQKTGGMLKVDEPHTFGFPSASPDLTLTCENADYSKMSKSEKVIWRHRDAFGEIKPSNNQGPNPQTPGTIPSVLVQCSDYARLFMSARPFMLFCVGLMIFGTKICLGIFDRDGVTVSPIYDMFDNAEVLVRVIYNLSCILSIEELGADPTVHLLADQETEQLINRKPNYPSAIVSSVGMDPRKWCTIGPPIWISVSFLGRGTHVWRVREYVEDEDGLLYLRGSEKVLKTSWRSSGRISESDIYMSIEGAKPKGLADFECGGDVRFSPSVFPITVRNLRSKDRKNLQDGEPSTPVLHRLILRTVGRPLYDYKSDLELLSGFRDALKAHKALCARGILHRDISAGNVLLAEKSIDGLHGFITDLEFARISKDTILLPQASVTIPVPERLIHGPHGDVLARKEATSRIHTKFESEVKVKRGEGMTGTAQFMAREILRYSPGSQVVHQAHHDVESFIWVLSYCVMRNVQVQAARKGATNEDKLAFKKLFVRAFGQATADEIADVRHNNACAIDFPTRIPVSNIITNFMSAPLIALFRDLQVILYFNSNPINPSHLKHEDLLEVVNKAIDALRES